MLRSTKRGISPLIATVLIIGMVVVASTIVFLWGRGYQEELIEKQGTLSLSTLSCATDIAIDVLRHDTSSLTIENTGSGKIDGFRLLVDDVPYDEPAALNPGDIAPVNYHGGSKIVVIPKIRIAKGAYQPCTEQKITYNTA